MASNDRDLNEEKERYSAKRICLLDEFAERMLVLQLILRTVAMLIRWIQKKSFILEWW